MANTGFIEKIRFLFLLYLRELAKLQLLKGRSTVIGITGSAGKTSMRNAVAAILKDSFRVKVSSKANSESGIPLNILGLTPKDYSFFDWVRLALLAPLKLLTNWEAYDFYVVEMGIDSPHPPKNMEYLLTIVKPTIAVFLNTLPVHSQYFDALVPKGIKDPRQRAQRIADHIAKEKGKLIRSLPKSGTAILNLDDRRVAAFAEQTEARVLSFATHTPADLTARDVKVSLSGFSVKVQEGSQTQELNLPLLLDAHYAQTLVGALAVGRACGLSLNYSIRSLVKNFRLPPGRMTVFSGIKGTTILDSSYNASTATMLSALDLLKKVAPGRKVAVLGDMRELGEISCVEHEKVAEVAARIADLIITVGPLMRRFAVPKLHSLGFPRRNLASFVNTHAAAKALRVREMVAKGDTILVKGSQNTIFLEIVVQKLLRDRRDEKRLCRQTPFWDKKREELRQSREVD